MAKPKLRLQFVVAISALFLVSLACGSSNEGVVITPQTQPTDVEDTSPSPSGPNESLPPEQPEDRFEVMSLGDVVEVKDHTIRLNSITYQGRVLVANFTVENQGTSDLNVSSLLSFSAKKGDGTKLEQEIFDCGTSGLDGGVLPGDKLRGDICWSGADPNDEIKIYYEASLFGSGAVVWSAVEGTAAPLETGGDNTPVLEVFNAGDIVEIQSHTIRLNSVEYQGTILIANFTIENYGDSDLDLSSIASFSTKKADGTKLEQEIFDCGTSGVDGYVLPGDRLRGDICWSGANSDDGIKIYYEASIFGEGAVVWDAKEVAAEPLPLTDATLKVDVYGLGEIIQVKDHTIVLNSVDFRGNILQANFTVENQGTSDLDISSILLFNARKRDGTSLEQEIFDCGSSLDGSVIPGDILRGDICWSGASPEDGIKLYYQAELFGEGAIVWLTQ